MNQTPLQLVRNFQTVYVEYIEVLDDSGKTIYKAWIEDKVYDITLKFDILSFSTETGGRHLMTAKNLLIIVR